MKRFVLIVLLIGVLVTLFLASYAKKYFNEQREAISSDKKLIIVEIKSGTSIKDIGIILQEKKFLRSSSFFSWYLKLWVKIGIVKAGTYELSPSMTLDEIIDILKNGKIARRWITIPEGYRLEQIAERLSDNKYVSKKEFIKRAIVKNFSSSFLKGLTPNTSLEGFLFPDTYDIGLNPTVDSIINQMLINFNRKTVLLRNKKVGNLTFYQILTLASIVERESSSSDDRKGIAGVYINRLSISMALQSDATIEYLTKKHDPTPSLADTKIESLYNTYLHSGLPPTPISNPGIDAILSTINYEKHDYLYFLTSILTDSKTIFSKTYQEHLENRRKYISQ